MRKRVIIVGGGTGGTIVANRLRRRFGVEEMDVHVVDRDDEHLYQPGLLFVPFGSLDVASLVRPRAAQLRPEIVFHRTEVERVDTAADAVLLADGTRLAYDVLVVASGAVLQPEETPGLGDDGWNEKVFTFYERESATELAGALQRFRGGRLVVDFVDLPIKCPVAPLEFTFLVDAFLRERGLRAATELVYATPLESAFTKPVCATHLSHLLEARGIELVTEFNAGEVDGVGGVLSSYDGRTVDFDLLVTVPLHGGAPYVTRSDGLGDGLGFVPVEKHTLQAAVAPNVFALGDAADVPTSKAGSVAHFEAEILVDNVEAFLDGRPLRASFDGHANCFVETGGRRALLIDFNYDVEPAPGRFGPLPLLRESRLNHVGKLLFQWVYWHGLLPGRDLPGIHPAMPLAGKHLNEEAMR
jgi:sulfide:quinone oxidoreductase